MFGMSFVAPTRQEWRTAGSPGDYERWRISEWDRRSARSNTNQRLGQGLAVGVVLAYLVLGRR